MWQPLLLLRCCQGKRTHVVVVVVVVMLRNNIASQSKSDSLRWKRDLITNRLCSVGWLASEGYFSAYWPWRAEVKNYNRSDLNLRTL
jgi:hypothetical protein